MNGAPLPPFPSPPPLSSANQNGAKNTVFAGLAITYALQFSRMANDVVETFADAEKMMVGLEMILEYSEETPMEETHAVEVSFMSRRMYNG